MRNGETIIEVRGLSNRFGEQVIHQDLDLAVLRGEILGVVGGSGTGKSVLMRSIIGLQTPAEGEVHVLGENMVGKTEDEAKNIRRRWGILFQNGALFSTLTVAENVEVPIREYFPYIRPPLLDEIASYKIAMGGLPADAGPKYPSELSGGMVKRAGLARALALDPELALPRRADGGPRPDLRSSVRRAHPLAPEAAGPHSLPDHARSRYAVCDLRSGRRARGSQGHRGRDDPRAIGFGSSLDTRIF